MNVSQVKAFMGDQKADEKAAVHPNDAIKQQLQKEGLQQAAEFAKQQAATVTVNSSQTTIGLKVVSGALNQNVSIDGKRPQDSQSSEESGKTSLFDFEKVAKNVLNFVGGVIRGAAEGGANDEKLNNLFSQAREGVSKGFAMAEKDLAGFMNDEIEEGITRLIRAIIFSIFWYCFTRFSKPSPVIPGASELVCSEEPSIAIEVR